MRMLALFLASTAILAAGCSSNQGSTTSNPSVSSTAPTGSGAVPPGGLVSATVLSDPADVKAVQNRLQQLNFYGGEITGLWTTDTEWGVRNFQQARGLPVGRLDQPIIRAEPGFEQRHGRRRQWMPAPDGRGSARIARIHGLLRYRF